MEKHGYAISSTIYYLASSQRQQGIICKVISHHFGSIRNYNTLNLTLHRRIFHQLTKIVLTVMT